MRKRDTIKLISSESLLASGKWREFLARCGHNLHSLVYVAVCGKNYAVIWRYDESELNEVKLGDKETTDLSTTQSKKCSGPMVGGPCAWRVKSSEAHCETRSESVHKDQNYSKKDWVLLSNREVHSLLGREKLGNFCFSTCEGRITNDGKVSGMSCLLCPSWNQPGPVFVDGPVDASFAVVGESPGREEILQQRPFVGPSGGLLRNTLGELGLESVFFLNACRCQPQDADKIASAFCCRDKMLSAIFLYPRDAVICFGAPAAASILKKKTGVRITQLNGTEQQTEVGRTFFCVHPAAVLRSSFSEKDFKATLGSIAGRLKEMPSSDDPIIVSSSCKSAPALAIDTETNLLSPYQASLLCSAFAWSPKEAFLQRGSLIPEPAFDPNLLKIFHNSPFDMEVIYAASGREVSPPIFDTQVAAHLLDENRPLSLEYLANSLLGRKHKNFSGWKSEGVTRAVIEEKCIEDACFTFGLYEVFKDKLAKEGFDDLYYSLCLPLCRETGRMQRRGVLIDEALLERLHHLLEEGKKSMLAKMREYAVIDPDSPSQVSQFLYDLLGLPAAVMTDKGSKSVSRSALVSLLGKHPFVESLLRYRCYAKWLGTHIKGILDNIDGNGVLHPNFSVTGTVSGRLSSSRPNLQTYGEIFKSVFVPRPSYKFLVVDYKQLEVRVLAGYSRDPALLKMVEEEDIHTAMARLLFGKDIVSGKEREEGKTAVFRIIYGGGPKGLAENTGISLEKAKAIVDNFRKRMPQAWEWANSQLSSAREKGYIVTMTGRKRRVPQVNSSDYEVRSHAERQLINAPIQSTAAEITHFGMLKAAKETKRLGLEVYPLLQVHDEVVFECAEEEVEQTMKIVEEALMGAYPKLGVPLRVDMKVADRWGDMGENIGEILDQLFVDYLRKGGKGNGSNSDRGL